MNLFMIVTFGLANAAVVIIGNEIGANKKVKQYQLLKRFHHYHLRFLYYWL